MQPYPTSVGVSDLRELLSTLRRRMWSIVLIAAVFVGGALLFAYTRTPLYASDAEVLVQPPLALSAIGNAPASTSISLDTERELVASTVVAQIVADEMGVDAGALLGHVSTSVPPNTQIIEITFSDPSPERAQRGAQAFADAYLEFRSQRSLDAFTSVRADIQRQIQNVQEGLQEARVDLAAADEGSPEQQQAQNEIELLTGQLVVYRNQLGTLSVFDVDPGEVIERAGLPTAAAYPDPVLYALIALLVGTAVGVVVALLRERLSDRVRGKSDLEEYLGAPVLAVVPRVSGWRRHKRAKLVVLEAPQAAGAEAYRTLRTNLQFLARSADVRVVLVTSPGPGQGATTTAANLSVTLAQTGKRVMALSCDLRGPRLHGFFRSTNDVGLTDILSNRATTEQAAKRVTGVSGLRVIASGPVEPAGAEKLASDTMGTLLAQLRGSADFVVIDTPPILTVADARSLVQWVDGVLLVVDATSATRTSVADAREALDQVEANVIGCVLNKLDPARASRSAEVHRASGDRSDRSGTRPEARPQSTDGPTSDRARMSR